MSSLEIKFMANWVARDEDGCVFAYVDKPHKECGAWLRHDGDGEFCMLPETSYPNVEWGDEQPFYLGVKNEEVTSENVEHPQHYNIGGIETIDIIKTMLTKEEYIGYLKGNILKYRERAQFKGKPDEDYAKAREYNKMLESVAKAPKRADKRVLKTFNEENLDRDPSALR